MCRQIYGLLFMVLALSSCASATGVRMNPVRGAAELPKDAEIRRDPGSRTILQLKSERLSAFLEQDAGFRAWVEAGRWREASLRLLDGYAGELGIEQPSREFELEKVTSDSLGFTHVKLRQVYHGLPVWDAELIVHWNRDKSAYLLNGRYHPTPAGLDLKPSFGGEAALRQALVAVGKSGCGDCQAELGIEGGNGSPPRLAYRIRIPDSLAEVWWVKLDAHGGALIEKILAHR